MGPIKKVTIHTCFSSDKIEQNRRDYTSSQRAPLKSDYHGPHFVDFSSIWQALCIQKLSAHCLGNDCGSETHTYGLQHA